MMRSVFRFSLAGFVSVTVTAAMFLMMLSLLKAPGSLPSHESLDVNFSINRSFEEIKHETRVKKPEPPKPQEAVQPPKVPPMNIEAEETPLNIDLPGITDIGIKTSPVTVPGLPPGPGGVDPGMGFEGGTIKYAIAPAYPLKPLQAKIEGWVELRMNINELGRVVGVEILDAYPKGHFENATRKGVKKWVFHPKIVNGQAVPFVATQKVEFMIDQE